MSHVLKNSKKKQKPSKGKLISKGLDTTKNYAYISLEECVLTTFIERVQKQKDKQPQVEIRIWV